MKKIIVLTIVLLGCQFTFAQFNESIIKSRIKEDLESSFGSSINNLTVTKDGKYYRLVSFKTDKGFYYTCSFYIYLYEDSYNVDSNNDYKWKYYGTYKDEYIQMECNSDGYVTKVIKLGYRDSTISKVTIYSGNGYASLQRDLHFYFSDYDEQDIYKNTLLYEYTFYSNGNMEEEIDIVNQKYKKYLSNGTLDYTVDFIDGYKYGSFVSHYDNGQIKAKGTYSRDELDGPYEEYDEDGSITIKGSFVEGEMYGLFTVVGIAYEIIYRYFNEIDELEKYGIYFFPGEDNDCEKCLVRLTGNFIDDEAIGDILIQYLTGETFGYGTITPDGDISELTLFYKNGQKSVHAVYDYDGWLESMELYNTKGEPIPYND